MAINTEIWGVPETWVDFTNNSYDIAEIKTAATTIDSYYKQWQTGGIPLETADLSPCFWGVGKNSIWATPYLIGVYTPDGDLSNIEYATKRISDNKDMPLLFTLGTTSNTEIPRYGRRYTPDVTISGLNNNFYTFPVVTAFNYQKILIEPWVIACKANFSSSSYHTLHNYMNSTNARTNYPYIVGYAWEAWHGEKGTRVQNQIKSSLRPFMFRHIDGSNGYDDKLYFARTTGIDYGNISAANSYGANTNTLFAGNFGLNSYYGRCTPNAAVSDPDTAIRYKYSNDNSMSDSALFPIYYIDESGMWEYGLNGMWRVVAYIDTTKYTDAEIIDYSLKQFAFLGLPFLYDPANYNAGIGDTGVYLPVFDADGVTTGNYVEGEAALNLPNARWIDGRESGYDPNKPPSPPEPTPTADPSEFYDEYNAEYLYALRQKHRRYKIRVELLGYYENVIGEITRDVSLGSSGQVTINNEQITRRSCSLNLINVDKKYLPSQDSAIWFNRKFKLWIGIEVGEKTYWWSYGVFYTQKATCDGDTVSIQGIDKGGALDGTIKTGMLDASCIIEAGTTLTNLIKDTLMWNEFSSPYLNHRTGASAYPVDPIAPIINTKFDKIVTQNEITINSNDYISTLFSSIADGYGADAYYNTNGHFCFQVMADESRIDGYRFMAHQWDFTDEDDMYSNASVDFNLDGYNVVTVYTNESGIENVSYTAANNNPASPLRLDSAGIRRMTDVEIPYVNVPQEEMEARCKAYADYLLMKEAMQGMSITFSCPIIPHLDVNRTIGITDKRYNLDNATFVVNSITMPLSAEAMTVNATQTSWLPDNTGIEGGGI